mgnify:CR=1 FL=1
MLTLVFTGCAKEQAPAEQPEGEQQGEEQPAEQPKEEADFDYDKDITVVARDAASGTRGAFHELMGIIQKDC